MQKRLRSLLACLALALASLGIVACGSASKSSNRSLGPALLAAGAREHDGDADNDSLGMGPYDVDHDALPTFGPAASAADRQAIVGLLGRFYRAAAAGNGARACSMLYWLVAEAVVEEQDRGKGSRSLRGRTCPQVASKLFAQRHRQLSAELAALRVTLVQVRDNRGWVVLDLGPARERVVHVHREHGAWKMDELLKEDAL